MAFRRRLLLLVALTAAALVAIWGRMFQLQVLSGDAWRRAAEASTRRRESVLGARGRIVDAKGEALAEDRTVTQLVFSPAEWASRERFRCRRCGAVAFARTPRYFDRAGQGVTRPRACSCGAKREELEPMPAEDLEPLETALHLPPGTLSAAAEDRMEEIARAIAIATCNRVLGLSASVGTLADRRVKAIRARLGVGASRARKVAIDEVLAELTPSLAEHSFEAEDARAEARADRYGRTLVLSEFEGPGGTRLERKRLPPDAERLLELDRDGRYRGFRSGPARERWYPRHGLLAQLIGITGSFSSAAEAEAFRSRYGAESIIDGTRVGRMGLEARYDEELRGTPGVLVREKDESGAFADVRVERAPVRGRDVRLHLDGDACAEAYHQLLTTATDEGFAGEGAASAAFVGLEAATGHVLWWGETPTFDLNGNLREITKRVDDEDGGSHDLVGDDATSDPATDPSYFAATEPTPGLSLSRVARVAIEPGSSLKLVTALALLHAGHALPGEFHCAGKSRGPDDLPGCHSHGPVDLEGMLCYSCNRYCADCASGREFFGLHRTLFPEWAHRLGIGASCGVDFPSSSEGRYPADLSPSLIRQIAIGQSVTATPLQMARLAALVANGRTLPFPRVAAFAGEDPVRDGGVDVDLDPSALARVRQGMRQCVERGTAHKAFENLPALAGVTVYGKTGTATATGRDWRPRLDALADEASDGVAGPRDGPWHLWFVGYAMKPGTPTVAFACVLHARKGKETGGDLAAPVVARFLSWWYAR